LGFDLTSMRFILFTVLMAIFFLPILTTSADFNYRLTKIECDSSNKTLKSIKCWLRAFNRRNPVANVEFTALRVVPHLTVNYQFCYTSHRSLPYRRIIYLENIEYCKIIRGQTSTPFIQQAVDYMNSLSRNIINVCNSTGLFVFPNISFHTSPFNTLFPAGHHLSNFRFFDENDANILNWTYHGILIK
jgi:hypothetical protein